MTTKTKALSAAATLEAEADSAKQLREQAQSAKADADATVTSAADALAEAQRRLSSGDSSVSAADLAALSADVSRTELLAAAAADVLTRAEAAEALAVSNRWAEVLSSTASIDAMDLEIRKAQSAIGKAVAALQVSVERRNGIIETATAEGRAAGLLERHVDPLAPVQIRVERIRPYGPTHDVLVVHDDEHRPMAPAEAVSQAVNAALTASGLALRIESK